MTEPLPTPNAARGGVAWLARPAVVLCVVPAMVVIVGLLIALVGWRQNVAVARSMAEEHLAGSWHELDRDLLARFGCSDALLGQVEAAARRLDGDADPAQWFRALAPLFAGRPELTYASFSTPDGRFFGVFVDGGDFFVNFNDQEGRGHRRRWKISGDAATQVLDDPHFAYDPRQRPFWSAAVGHDGPTWTAPYRFVSPAQQVGITRTQAVYAADHRLLGVVTVDWTTAALSRSLADSQSGTADRLVLTAADDAVLLVCGAAVPPARARDAPVERVHDLQDPVVDALFDARPASGDGFVDLVDPRDGERYLAMRRPIGQQLGWTLALASRIAPLLAPARSHLLAAAALIAVILPIALLLAWIYARHVVRMNLAAQQARDAATAAAAEAQLLRLEHERQRLEQLSTMGLLAGSVAHDLRNSIGCVTPIASLLRTHAQDPQKTASYADMLSQAVDQTNRMCEDLLRLARRESTATAGYDAHEAVLSAARAFHATDPRISVDVAGLRAERHRLHGNRDRFHSSLLNLFLNARDAMKGSGVIAVASALVEVSDRVLAAGTHLQISVADTGEGMDAERLARCQESLYTTKGDYGTGLGLFSVKRMVKEHRGTMRIDSAPGRGTTVTLLFPLAAET